MKSNFNISPELMKVEETLAQHKPYSFLSISTTGIDNDEHAFHEPIRAVMARYEFNESRQAYEQTKAFDEYVKCSDSSLKYGKKTFEANDIDINEYSAGNVGGKKVLAKSEFDSSLLEYIRSLDANEIIMSNNNDFVFNYLERSAIDAAKELRKRSSAHYAYDIKDIAEAVSGKRNMSLKQIRETFAFSASDNADSLYKKIDVMDQLVQKIGRDKGIIFGKAASSKREEVKKAFDTAYESEREELSEIGRENYRSSSNEEKMAFWKEKGIVDIDAVMNRESDCDLNKLFDLLDKKNGNKGFMILHGSTTGFNAGNEIIQLTLRTYEIDEHGDVKKLAGFSGLVSASKENVDKAIEIAESGGFDAFAYAGIDREGYVGNPTLLSSSLLMKKVNNFTKKYPLKDYPLVVLGKDRNSSRSFIQNALMKYGNSEVIDAPYMDFTQMIKEYVCYTDVKNGLENLMIPNGVNIKNYTLEGIGEANGVTALSNCKLKCNFIASLMSTLSQQYQQERALIENTIDEKAKEESAKEEPKQTEMFSESEEVSEELLEKFKAEINRPLSPVGYVETDIADASNYIEDVRSKVNAEEKTAEVISMEGLIGNENESPNVDYSKFKVFETEEPVYENDKLVYEDDNNTYADDEPETVADEETSYAYDDTEPVYEEPVYEKQEEPIFDPESEEAVFETPAEDAHSFSDEQEHDDDEEGYDLFASLQTKAQERESVQQGSEEIFGLMDKLSSAIDTLNDKVDEISEQMGEIRSSLGEISQRQIENDERIDRVSSAISQISDIDDNIAQVLEENGELTSEINRNVKTIREAADKLQSEQEKTTEHLHSIMSLLEKTKRLQKMTNREG